MIMSSVQSIQKIFSEKFMQDFVYRFVYLNKKLVWNILINVVANLPKHFVKCLCPLSKPFTEYFRKVSETYPVIIVETFKATFLANLQKIFVQVYRNIGSRSLWPRYQYLEKTFQKSFRKILCIVLSILTGSLRIIFQWMFQKICHNIASKISG